jgi:iron complex transport system substrate-binding protein
MVTAAANASLIYDSRVREMIRAGSILDIGKDYQPDYERILAAKPTVVFADGENASASQIYTKLKTLGLSVVSPRDYFEQDPLARAEWITFFAFFTHDEQRADSICHVTERKYANLKSRSDSLAHHPTVFCNLPYNDVWYMPTGQNYTARLIADAGGDFIWSKAVPTNGFNLSLHFEQVYERAAHADYWLNPSLERQLGALRSKNFRLFDAVQHQQVFNCTRRQSNGGGLDMWESGPYRPDVVLHDLQVIFRHGSDTALHYYERLR